MKLFIIARVLSNNGTESKDGDVIAYRIIDADKPTDINNISLDSIEKVLSNPKTSNIIANAAYVNGEVVGTNGQLSRYADIDYNGSLLNSEKSPLVIINKLGDAGYTVCDYKGVIKRFKTSDVVEYARKFGIANGKVVNQDGTEIISAITGNYEVIEIKQREKGDKINLNLDGNRTNIAKEAAQDVEVELQYNDSLNNLNTEQVSIIKQFYMWYTVSQFNKMSKGSRFNVPASKLNKLAALRGIDQWKFAGIWDTANDHRKAKCELGHALRYEYYALPADVADKINGKLYDRANHARITSRGRNGYIQELRDNGAIVFGEVCAADFFEIDPEDMKALVKIRKDMSQEIDIMSTVAGQHLEQLQWNNIKLIVDLIKALGSAQNVYDIFGYELGMLLLSFIKADVPFPRSLVLLISSEVNKSKDNQKKLLNLITNNSCKDAVEYIFAKESGKYSRGDMQTEFRRLFDFIFNFSIEGEYMYDPIRDNNNTRRDIGGYNKKTRDERLYLESTILNYTNIRVDKDISAAGIIKILKYIQLGINTANQYDNIINTTDNKLIQTIKNFKNSGYTHCKFYEQRGAFGNFVVNGISFNDDKNVIRVSTIDFKYMEPLVHLLSVNSTNDDSVYFTHGFKCYLEKNGDYNGTLSFNLEDNDVITRIAKYNMRHAEANLYTVIDYVFSKASDPSYVKNCIQKLLGYFDNYEKMLQEEIDNDTKTYYIKLMTKYRFKDILNRDKFECPRLNMGVDYIQDYFVVAIDRKTLEYYKKAVVDETDDIIDIQGFIELPAKVFMGLEELSSYDYDRNLSRFKSCKERIIEKEDAIKQAEEKAKKAEEERLAFEAQQKSNIEKMVEKQAEKDVKDMTADDLYYGFETAKLTSDESARMIGFRQSFDEIKKQIKVSNETKVDTEMLRTVLGFSESQVQDALEKKKEREKNLNDALEMIAKNTKEIIDGARARENKAAEAVTSTPVDTTPAQPVDDKTDSSDKTDGDKIMADLKRLIEENPTKTSYRITIAKDILSRNISYNKASYKQKYIIEQALLELNDNKEIDGIKPAVSYKVSENADLKKKVEAIDKALKSGNSTILKEIDDASKIIEGVMRTIKNKGECSEKQMKHIDAAYEVAKKYV